MKKTAKPNPFRCFTAAAYAGTLFVLLFAASVAEDQVCLSVRLAGAPCDIFPPAFFWVGGLIAAGLLAWSGFRWWRDFVVGKYDSSMVTYREQKPGPTSLSSPREPARTASTQDSSLA